MLKCPKCNNDIDVVDTVTNAKVSQRFTLDQESGEIEYIEDVETDYINHEKFLCCHCKYDITDKVQHFFNK